MKNQITPSELKDDHNCAKLIAKKLFDIFDYQYNDHTLQPLQGMGEGMEIGSLCGALNGATFAVNLILENIGADRDTIDTELKLMKDRFKKKYGGFECRDILPQSISIDNFEDKDKPERLLYCSDLLTDTTYDVSEIVNYIISISSPIMRRFMTI